MKKYLKKHLALIFIFLIFVGLTSYYSNVSNLASAYNGFTIVLDAGHGGRDGGSIGANGTIEKEINLEYCILLKKKLVNLGYRIVLTRETDDGLYSNLANNKKVDDMNKRMEIIKKTNPNLVLSIHMNSYPDRTICGAMTYHKIDDEASENCADLIHKCLKKKCNTRNSQSKPGDFFMMNCSYYTSVLVECGFLSNPEEEKLLKTDEYKAKIVDAICNGILLYFGNVISNI